ncbi:hypothetical protein [Streptomyces sp. NBC_00212]|uniref:hypothetical protein n=1 Tax=Streptomyces sp. NBC_00212 TaxID=2975684 RepID=UPI00324B5193
METEAPRRVPVVLYVATSDSDAAELLGVYCRQYAAARDWAAVEVVTDTDRQAPLMSRTGWVRVLTLLSAGTVRGIVTYSAPMIAAPLDEFTAVRDLLQDRGAFLCVARSLTCTPAPPARHTAGQMARRQEAADASTGYEGCGADWGTIR